MRGVISERIGQIIADCTTIGMKDLFNYRILFYYSFLFYPSKVFYRFHVTTLRWRNNSLLYRR